MDVSRSVSPTPGITDDRPSERPAMPIGPINYPVEKSKGCASDKTTSRQKKDSERSSSSTSPILSEDLLRMFEQSTLADLEISCYGPNGTSQTFQAHRLVLAARSPVFRAMLVAGMREHQIGKVCIPDVTPEAVKCMLDFSYKDECPDIASSNVLDVLKLGDKYDLPGLKDFAIAWMARNANSHNIVSFLVAAETYHLFDFKYALLNALLDNSPALHECVNGENMDQYPELLKQLLCLCAHRLHHSKERHVVKHFDGLPYRSKCFLCAREVEAMSKQMLGELLFPMVQKVRPDLANKVTGMIIELDNVELVPLFESEHALGEKVEEAVAVLEAAEIEATSTANSQPEEEDEVEENGDLR